MGIFQNSLLAAAASAISGDVTEGALYMWGGNGQGGLGDGSTTNRSSPVQIGSDTTYQGIDGGPQYTTSIKSDGTVWCTGDGNSFKTGTGSNDDISSPVQIDSATDWNDASMSFPCGGYGTSIIKEDGTFWVWGRSPPNGTYDYAEIPEQIGSLTDWSQASEGLFGGHAVKTDGTLWVWGYSDDGIAGVDPFPAGADISPVQIGTLTDWKQVSRSRSGLFAMAVKTDGTLWGWGQQTYGQIGVGNTTKFSSVVQVGSLTDWDEVHAGVDTFIAVKTDGTLWGCGRNNYWQLGQGNTTDVSSPIQVGSETYWVQASLGDSMTMARTSDGTIYCWGNQAGGRLGIGEESGNKSSPVQLGSETDWIYLKACNDHTGGIRGS